MFRPWATRFLRFLGGDPAARPPAGARERRIGYFRVREPPWAMTRARALLIRRTQNGPS